MMKSISSSEVDRLITEQKNERSFCFICAIVFSSFAIGTAILLAIVFFS